VVRAGAAEEGVHALLLRVILAAQEHVVPGAAEETVVPLLGLIPGEVAGEGAVERRERREEPIAVEIDVVLARERAPEASRDATRYASRNPELSVYWA
jgi:hypothetical protein